MAGLRAGEVWGVDGQARQPGQAPASITGAHKGEMVMGAAAAGQVGVGLTRGRTGHWDELMLGSSAWLLSSRGRYSLHASVMDGRRMRLSVMMHSFHNGVCMAANCWSTPIAHAPLVS